MRDRGSYSYGGREYTRWFGKIARGRRESGRERGKNRDSESCSRAKPDRTSKVAVVLRRGRVFCDLSSVVEKELACGQFTVGPLVDY